MVERADDRAARGEAGRPPEAGREPSGESPVAAPSGTLDSGAARSATAHAMSKSPRRLGPVAVVRSNSEDPALARTSTPESAGSHTPGPDAPVSSASPDDEGPDPFVARTLGGLYRIVSRIGVGGMGVVYLAEHVHIGKRFAVKVLSRSVAQHPQAVERLKQEAITASKIEHDNIVSIISFDRTDDGDVFIVMELLRGRDLARDLEQGRLPLERALRITYQVCRALGAAHAAGIVHRDLKPENIFLTDKNGYDFVKLLDFGISKVKRADMESVRMTKTGQLVGTPLYMSPEQARGETDVDTTADIYSLGVILYEMLCGTPPFEAENYFQLLWKHGSEPPEPPRKRAPDAGIPEALEGVILKALEKDPRDRFQTMEEFETALAAAVPDLDVSLPLMGFPSLPPDHSRSTPSLSGRTAALGAEPPVVVPRPRNGLAIGAAVLGVAILGGAVWLATRDPSVPPGPPPAHAEGPRSRPEKVASRSADPVPAPVPPDPTGNLPPAPAPVEEVSVTFESSPPGADVLIEDRLLGTTPITAPLPRGAALRVVLRKRGFLDDVRSLIPAAGARIESRLRPARRSSGGSGGGGDTLPIKKSL